MGCSVTSAIATLARAKKFHILKFVAFLKDHFEAPFYAKCRVFEAVLYGCESLFNADFRSINKIYNWEIKKLLGVGMSTCKDLRSLESGFPTLRAVVTQRKFFPSMWLEMRYFAEDPWTHAVNLTQATRTPTTRHIAHLINTEVNVIG